MNKLCVNKKKQVKKTRRYYPTLTVPTALMQNIERASLDLELQHKDKSFANAMEKLTTTEFVEVKINEFKNLIRKVNNFLQLQEKCEYYIMNFGFGLRALCSSLILNGYIDGFQLNISGLKEYIEEYLTEYLQPLKEDIAGLINPFEVFEPEIAEKKFESYLGVSNGWLCKN